MFKWIKKAYDESDEVMSLIWGVLIVAIVMAIVAIMATFWIHVLAPEPEQPEPTGQAVNTHDLWVRTVYAEPNPLRVAP